jgi:hypothetical protein
MWSSDEMKVYVTTGQGNFYGNAKTGKSYMVSYGPFEAEDKNHLIEPPYHSYGTWVLQDTYVLARWYEWYEGIPGYISFFDPAKKAYRNLSALLGLPYILHVGGVQPDPPYPCQNGQPTAPDGGRYVWVNCQDGGRLIDMQTFKAKTFPDYPEAILTWSADGNFAFLGHSNDPDQQILSAVGNQLKSMPADARCYTWHPTQSVFMYLDKNKLALSIFDARSMSVRQTVTLPTAFRCPKWNKSANKLIMIAEDESLWQINYPALTQLEQLTKPIKGLKSFASSPDDALIAFSVDLDIYIVDTKRKP